MRNERCRPMSRHFSAIGVLSSTLFDYKSRLCKISVKGQSFGRSGFPHHYKRDAIYQAPFFIIVLFVCRQTVLEKTVIYFKHLDVLSAAQNLDDFNCFFSEVFG